MPNRYKFRHFVYWKKYSRNTYTHIGTYFILCGKLWISAYLQMIIFYNGFFRHSMNKFNLKVIIQSKYYTYNSLKLKINANTKYIIIAEYMIYEIR